MPKTPSLKTFRRIVVKVGSSLLVDSSAGGLKHDWLVSHAHSVALYEKANEPKKRVSAAPERAAMSRPRSSQPASTTCSPSPSASKR